MVYKDKIMKFCKDCKHHRAHYYNNETMAYRDDCKALKDQENPLLGGKIVSIECGLMRATSLCGWEGNLWEAKE